MDIKELLEDLSKKVTDPSFSELAKSFRSTISQTRGLSNDEKRELYQQFNHLWDERKAWLENLKHEQEQQAMELDYQLDAVERSLESPDFIEQSRLFEKEFRKIGRWADEQKHKLWDRYTAIKEHRSEYIEKTGEISGTMKNTFETDLLSIDTVFGGAPELQPDSHWERVGSRIQESRDKLRDIRKAIDSDIDLLRHEKRILFELVDTVRAKIKETETLTFQNHGKRASELYEEAKDIVEHSNPGKAAEFLKELQSNIRMLWLKKGEKDKYLNHVEELWAALKDKRRQRKDQFQDWLEKQKEGLVKLKAVREKAYETLLRVQKNLEDNRQRFSDAKSPDFSEKLEIWIREGAAKEADIQKSVNDLDKKLAEIEDKLKKHGMNEVHATAAVSHRESTAEITPDETALPCAEK